MKLNPLSDRVVVRPQEAQKKLLQVLFYLIQLKKNLRWGR